MMHRGIAGQARRTVKDRSRRIGSSVVVTQARGLAVPVNKRSSVDPLLGISPPEAPRPQPDSNKAEGSSNNPALLNFLAGTHRPNNPNDLTELLRGGGKNASPFQRGNVQNAANQRSRTAAAIGAMRRSAGSTIPTQDLEDAFLPPDAPQAAQQQQQQEPDQTQHQPEVRVNPTPVDRESPHPIDAIYGRNDLDERVLAAARALHYARGSGSSLNIQTSTLSTLLEEFHSRSERTLSVELPNESRPKENRKVPITSANSTESELNEKSEDGVLLIAYVTGLTGGRGNERISVCSGFAVEGGERLSEGESTSKGALVVTCAHTLRGSLPTKPQSSQSTSAGKGEEESSVALAITRSGHIFPITSLLSSLPTSDLILLQLGEEAIVVPDESPLGAPLKLSSSAQIRTLPVNPYPAQVGSELCVSSFWGWEDDAGSTLPAFEFISNANANADSTGGGLEMQSTHSLIISPNTFAPPAGREKETVKRERDDAGRSRWGRARLVEYRDMSGHEALPGTYDELAQLDFKLLTDSPHNPPALQTKSTSLPAFPPPGSSGGPIVDAATGTVVGVTRGTKMSQLGGSRGDGIPAEKVFFFFALPGFPKK